MILLHQLVRRTKVSTTLLVRGVAKCLPLLSEMRNISEQIEPDFQEASHGFVFCDSGHKNQMIQLEPKVTYEERMLHISKFQEIPVDKR